MTWLGVLGVILVALAVRCWRDERAYMRHVAEGRAAFERDMGRHRMTIALVHETREQMEAYLRGHER